MQKVCLFLAIVFFAALVSAQRREREDPSWRIDCRDERYRNDPRCRRTHVPVIQTLNPIEELLYINPERDYMILMDVDTESHFKTFWSLDPKLHSQADDREFFRYARRQETTGDLFLPAGRFEEGKIYTLVFRVTDEEGLETSHGVVIRFTKPSLEVSLTVDPESGPGWVEEFEFKLKRNVEETINFALQYAIGDSNRLVTIGWGTWEAGKDFSPLFYKFPMPREDSTEVTLYLNYNIQHDKDFEVQTIEKKIVITSPKEAPTLEDLDNMLQEAEEHPEGIDGRELAVVANSIGNVAFGGDDFHSSSFTVLCDRDYCHGHGKCVEVHFHWKKCECNRGFEGPTCAFQSRFERPVIDLYAKLLILINKARITDQNIGHLTEALKTIASVRHVNDFGLLLKLIDVIPRIIDRLNENANEVEIVEDLMIALENVQVGLQQYHYTHEHALKDQVQRHIDRARELIARVIERIVRYKKKRVFYHSTPTIAFSVVTSDVSRLQEDDETVYVKRKSIIAGEQDETIHAHIPRTFLENVAAEEDHHQVAIVAFEAIYNPYEVVMDESQTVVSGVLELRVFSQATGEELPPQVVEDGVIVVFSKPQLYAVNPDHVQCGVYLSEEKLYSTELCYTEVHDSHFRCTCGALGTFALVINHEEYEHAVDEYRRTHHHDYDDHYDNDHDDHHNNHDDNYHDDHHDDHRRDDHYDDHRDDHYDDHRRDDHYDDHRDDHHDDHRRDDHYDDHRDDHYDDHRRDDHYDDHRDDHHDDHHDNPYDDRHRDDHYDNHHDDHHDHHEDNYDDHHDNHHDDNHDNYHHDDHYDDHHDDHHDHNTDEDEYGYREDNEEHRFDDDKTLPTDGRDPRLDLDHIKPKDPNTLEQEVTPLPIPTGESHYKLSQIIFTVVFFALFWGLMVYLNRTDGTANSAFIEDLTVHPIYSIVSVNQGSLPKISRLQLVFLSLSVQLAIESKLLNNGWHSLLIALVSVLVSCLTNYIFSYVARTLMGSHNTSGRLIYTIFAHVVIIIALLFTNLQLAATAEDHLLGLLGVFIAGILLDFVVLDGAMLFLSRFEPFRTLVRVRGFFYEVNIAQLAFRELQA